MRARRSSVGGVVEPRLAELAAIARREWLLQMLALGAAGCVRSDPARSRASMLIMAVDSIDAIRPDWTDADFLLFSPLVERDERGDFVPRLAERWEHSHDYREWTYHLCRDVRCQSGLSPGQAEDRARGAQVRWPGGGGCGPDRAPQR